MKESLVREIAAAVNHPENTLPLIQMIEGNEMFQSVWDDYQKLEAMVQQKKMDAIAAIDAEFAEQLSDAEDQLRMCLRLVR